MYRNDQGRTERPKIEDHRISRYVQRIQNSWFFDVAGFFKIYLRVKVFDLIDLKAWNGPERSWTRNGSMWSSPDQPKLLSVLVTSTSRPHLTRWPSPLVWLK